MQEKKRCSMTETIMFQTFLMMLLCRCEKWLRLVIVACYFKFVVPSAANIQQTVRKLYDTNKCSCSVNIAYMYITLTTTFL